MKEIIASGRTELPLGRQGENHAVRVEFPVSEWITEYGDGTFLLIAQRPTDRLPYPVDTELVGESVYWTVSDADTAKYGYGFCEMRWIVGETVVKSQIWRTLILESMPDAGDAPPPYESWVNEVLYAAERTERAVSNPPYIGDNGNWFVWNETQGAFADSGVSAKPSFFVVSALPTVGESGKIYLISNSGTGTNRYDEYIWVNAAWEKIGTTDLDLSGYALKTENRVFFGRTSDTGTTRTVTLTTDSNSRWDSLKDGDILFCFFENAPTETGLDLKIKNFTARTVYTFSSGGTYDRIRIANWHNGTLVALAYNLSKNAFFTVSEQYATTNYYGLTILSSSVSSTEEGRAASSKAVKTAYDTALPGKTFTDMVISFRVKGTVTGTDECFTAPVGTWANFINSRMNPVGYVTEDGECVRVFKKQNTTDVYFLYEPEHLLSGAAKLYTNQACTSVLKTTSRITAGATYYYKDAYTE